MRGTAAGGSGIPWACAFALSIALWTGPGLAGEAHPPLAPGYGDLGYALHALLAEAFDTRTPAMDTADFEACVGLHADSIQQFRPHVLVGSSFGGAVAVALLQRGMRLDESTPGHGIGLAVVKDIARSYGGRLSIQKSELGGAEIMVSIPPLSAAS